MGTTREASEIIETKTIELEDLLGKRSRGDIDQEKFVKGITDYLNELILLFIQANEANDNANLIEIRERLKEIYNVDSEALIYLILVYFSAQKKIAKKEANFFKIFLCCEITAEDKTDEDKR